MAWETRADPNDHENKSDHTLSVCPVGSTIRQVARVLQRPGICDRMADRRVGGLAIRRRSLPPARGRHTGMAEKSNDHVRGRRPRPLLVGATVASAGDCVSGSAAPAPFDLSLGARASPYRPGRRLLAREGGQVMTETRLSRMVLNPSADVGTSISSRDQRLR